MKYKYIIALLVSLSFFYKADAQFADTLAILHPENLVSKQDSALKVKHQRNKYYYIGLNLGYCPPSISFPSNFGIDGEYYTDATPVFVGNIGYDFFRFLNTGIAIAYQETTLTGTVGHTSDDLTMLNTSVHLSAHINKNRESFDHYIGIRVGYSYLTDQPISTRYGSQYSPPTMYALTGPSEYSFTYQLFYGVTFYSENVGFNIELGLGSPFLIKGGLSIRLGRKGNKKFI